jgi:hypothetical protein
MTTNQTRYNVFLSHDNDYWEPIQLKYYDQFGFPELTFVQPYQPRIRWQLWFKFLRFYNQPKWYQKLLYVLTIDPISMRSIVKQNQSLETNYRYVKVCYQNIEFDLNQDLSDNSKYWQVNEPEQCQIFDVSRFRLRSNLR